MIRKGNLIEEIADFNNLELAFWKAAKGKNESKEVLQYRKNLNQNLFNLRRQILSGNINVGNYYYFKIFDPKERIICAAEFSERVLHHALMNICQPYFDKIQIQNSFACRKNKGTHAALDKAKINSQKYKWYLKLDFRKYFQSINHQILILLLNKTFKDKVLLKIFEQIINSYNADSKKGIPIGNLSSQYFANHFLSTADHYAIEKIKIPAYVRYMDDVIVWANSKQELLEFYRKFNFYCINELDLELKPLILNKMKFGLSFLGFKFYRNKVLLNNRSKKRFKEKMKLFSWKLKNKHWTQKEFQRYILPIVSFTEYAESLEYRKKIISLYGQ